MSLPHQWTQTKDSHLLSLRGSGLPWHRIAAELHVGRNAAIERARHLGIQPTNRVQPPALPRPIRLDRPALPSGHPLSWQAITDGTPLEGAAYPFPVYL